MNLVAVTFKSLIVCDGSFPQKVVFILYLVLHFSKFHVYADNKGRESVRCIIWIDQRIVQMPSVVVE